MRRSMGNFAAAAVLPSMRQCRLHPFTRDFKRVHLLTRDSKVCTRSRGTTPSVPAHALLHVPDSLPDFPPDGLLSMIDVTDGERQAPVFERDGLRIA